MSMSDLDDSSASAGAAATEQTVSELTVRLDSADGPGGSAVYRAGHLITGRVRLRLARPLTLRNLDLLIQGSGTVGWGQGGGHFVRDDEVYLNDMAELVATGLGEVVTLSVGEHVFPFACSLPHHLPATFSGNFGSVAYSAKVVMQAESAGAGGPWVASAPFAVEAQLSLAEHSDQLAPCVVDARMLVSSGRRRHVKATLSLPRRVFATQEDLVIDASVANRSRKTISRLSVGLVMECLYQAGGQQQFRESLVVADRADEYRFGHMEGRCWKNVRLRIPRLVPPSGLPHCRLASVSYALVFRAEVERCSKDLNLRVPIVVGVALPEGSATVDGESTADAKAAAADGGAGDRQLNDDDFDEPEVMRRLSREASANVDSASGSEESLRSLPRQQQRQQRPEGSTEKAVRSSYYVFDPAAQRAPSHAEAGTSAAAATGGSDNGIERRFLPTEYNGQADVSEDLY